MTEHSEVLDGPAAVRWCDRCKASVPQAEWRLSTSWPDSLGTSMAFRHVGVLRDLAPGEPPSECGFRVRVRSLEGQP